MASYNIAFLASSVDKAKEWKDRLNRRNANKSVNELPFGLNDKSIEVSITMLSQPRLNCILFITSIS